MRPKKKVLILDADETRLGVMRFMLVTNGLAVLGAVDEEEAVRSARNSWLDVLVVAVGADIPEAHRVITRLRGIVPDMRVLALTDSGSDALAASDCGADLLLRLPACGPAVVLEAVKMLAARRRGRRKGFRGGGAPRETIAVTAEDVKARVVLKRGPVGVEAKDAVVQWRRNWSQA